MQATVRSRRGTWVRGRHPSNRPRPPHSIPFSSLPNSSFAMDFSQFNAAEQAHMSVPYLQACSVGRPSRLRAVADLPAFFPTIPTTVLPSTSPSSTRGLPMFSSLDPGPRSSRRSRCGSPLCSVQGNLLGDDAEVALLDRTCFEAPELTLTPASHKPLPCSLRHQMQDFMKLYSGLVERCFNSCVTDFTSKVLTGKEVCPPSLPLTHLSTR